MAETPHSKSGLATYPLRVADLSVHEPRTFHLEPDAEARAAIAEALDLLSLRKLRFKGVIAAEGKSDWRLDATLGATVVQPCVATLEPVTTRIDVPVVRVYSADMSVTPEGVSEGNEIEMPEDETLEPLGRVIDPGQVMIEALALALPDYPRHESAGPVDTAVTEPGKDPMTDDETRPFAGLAGLRDKLEKDT